MAKISQVITRPAKEYDYTVAEAQTRDLDGIVEKLTFTTNNSANLDGQIRIYGVRIT